MCVCPQDVHSPLRGQRSAVWSGLFFCVWAVRLMCLYPLSHLSSDPSCADIQLSPCCVGRVNNTSIA